MTDVYKQTDGRLAGKQLKRQKCPVQQGSKWSQCTICLLSTWVLVWFGLSCSLCGGGIRVTTNVFEMRYDNELRASPCSAPGAAEEKAPTYFLENLTGGRWTLASLKDWRQEVTS